MVRHSYGPVDAGIGEGVLSLANFTIDGLAIIAIFAAWLSP
jgi:hypothetical protein